MTNLNRLLVVLDQIFGFPSLANAILISISSPGRPRHRRGPARNGRADRAKPKRLAHRRADHRPLPRGPHHDRHGGDARARIWRLRPAAGVCGLSRFR